MSLILKLISPINKASKQVSECTFDESGGSIGRHPNNKFVLIDENRYVSGKHAVIEYDQDNYYIIDHSTNGVCVDSRVVGSGNRISVVDGETISIGAFQMQVHISSNIAHTPLPDLDLGIGQVAQNNALAADLSDGLDNQRVPQALVHNFSATSSVKNIEADVGDLEDDLQALLDDNPSQLLSDPHKNIPEPAVINGLFTPPNVIPDDWDILADGPEDPLTTTPEPVVSVDKNKHRVNESSASPSIPASSSLLDSVAQNPVTPSPSTPPSHSAMTDNALLTAFCEGIGVDINSLKPADPIALMRRVGKMTRINADGLMQLLHVRSTVKSNFRLDQTMMASTENNPLKFSMPVTDALKILLLENQPGYLSTTDAYEQGYKDLQAHELAVMAGMQSTLRALVEQLDPQQLEQKFDAQSRSSLMSNKKAKLWEQYCEYYHQFVDNIAEDFEEIFGEKFAEVYEEQIKKIP